MLVYLSGPITHDPDYRYKFGMYRSMLEALGYEVVDPSILVRQYEKLNPAAKWCMYMQRDLVWLKQCDYIFFMPDWENSRGARIERRFAKRMGIPVLILGDM